MGEFFTKEVRKHAEQILEMELGVAIFTIEKTPAGGAPEAIRKEWVGIGLPLRRLLLEEHGGDQQYFDLLTAREVTNIDTVPVHGADAVMALDGAGRTRAVDYWLPLVKNVFNFRGGEGSITSPQYVERTDNAE